MINLKHASYIAAPTKSLKAQAVKGFSLLEFSVSLLVVSLGLLGLMHTQQRSQQMLQEAQLKRVATAHLRSAAALMRAQSRIASSTIDTHFLSLSASQQLPAGQLNFYPLNQSGGENTPSSLAINLIWGVRGKHYEDALLVAP